MASKSIMRSGIEDWVSFTVGSTTYFEKLGEGFTALDENLNPTTSSKQYICDDEASTNTTGYETSFSFTTDFFDSERATRHIYNIARNRKVGADGSMTYYRLEKYKGDQQSGETHSISGTGSPSYSLNGKNLVITYTSSASTTVVEGDRIELSDGSGNKWIGTVSANPTTTTSTVTVIFTAVAGVTSVDSIRVLPTVPSGSWKYIGRKFDVTVEVSGMTGGGGEIISIAGNLNPQGNPTNGTLACSGGDTPTYTWTDVAFDEEEDMQREYA